MSAEAERDSLVWTSRLPSSQPCTTLLLSALLLIPLVPSYLPFIEAMLAMQAGLANVAINILL